MSCLASLLQLLPDSIAVSLLGLGKYWRGLVDMELVHRVEHQNSRSENALCRFLTMCNQWENIMFQQRVDLNELISMVREKYNLDPKCYTVTPHVDFGGYGDELMYEDIYFDIMETPEFYQDNLARERNKE